MKTSLKITILSDKNSWINTYNIKLKEKLEKLNHSVSLIHSLNYIVKGDILFLLSFSEILSKKELSLNKNNIVVHASDLPHGKGMSPMSWQILEGKNEITLSLFEALEKLDAGNIYLKLKINLKGNELVYDWRNILGNKTVDICIKFIKNYPICLENHIKQTNIKDDVFYRRRNPNDSEIDINQTIKEQFNLLRIVDNEEYPAFFKINKTKYIIKIYKIDK